MTITVIGSINADINVYVDRHPNPGETLLGTGGMVSPGGKGANQAVAAALLGADVHFVGAVGSDPYTEAALAGLRRSGANLDAVTIVDQPTGLALITVAKSGENSIVVVPGANATVTAEAVEKHTELIGAADIVLLQGEIPAEGFHAAIQAARGRVVVNLAPVIEVDPDLLRKADPLIANEHEAKLISGRTGTPEELAKALLEQGFSSVVLTLGGAGALVATPTALTPIPTPKVTPVETTGAGDAFAGALVAQLDTGASLVDAAIFATRVGAFAVTGRGAQDSYPTATDELPVH